QRTSARGARRLPSVRSAWRPSQEASPPGLPCLLVVLTPLIPSPCGRGETQPVLRTPSPAGRGGQGVRTNMRAGIQRGAERPCGAQDDRLAPSAKKERGNHPAYSFREGPGAVHVCASISGEPGEGRPCGVRRECAHRLAEQPARLRLVDHRGVAHSGTVTNLEDSRGAV